MLLNDRESYKVGDAASLKSLVAKVNRNLAQPKEDKALAVEMLTDLLRQNYDGDDDQDLIELVGNCLKTFFTFEGITYEQIKDSPMGPPIFGLISEAVLQKLDRRLLEEYKPKFWTRYVDDTLVIIDRDKFNFYTKILNSVNPVYSSRRKRK
nr:unnamed protein product [Spirometra erinaceieuropaei]